MIDFFFNVIDFIAGVMVSGLGFAITLAGLKLIITGLGWLF